MLLPSSYRNNYFTLSIYFVIAERIQYRERGGHIFRNTCFGLMQNRTYGSIVLEGCFRIGAYYDRHMVPIIQSFLSRLFTASHSFVSRPSPLGNQSLLLSVDGVRFLIIYRYREQVERILNRFVSWVNHPISNYCPSLRSHNKRLVRLSPVKQR